MMTALVISIAFASESAWGQPAGSVSAAGLSKTESAKKFQERDFIRVEVEVLTRAGRLDEAAKLAEAEISLTRGLMGELHEDVVGSLMKLGELHESREDWAAARTAVENVISILERQPGWKEWRIADARRALTDLERRAALAPNQRRQLQEAYQLAKLQVDSHSQGRYAEGIAPGRRAMAIQRELLGEGHPYYAACLNSQGTLYQAMGDFATAEPLLRRGLEIRKQALGEEHPEYARSLQNLGFLYHYLGDNARAEPLYRQALEIRKRALGEEHPQYANSLNNLGMLCLSMGNKATAEPLLRQGLEIRKQALGEEHPDYARSVHNLGFLYQHMGDNARAESLYRQALEIKKRVLGEKHPEYAISLNCLGSLYEGIEDYARAEPLLRKSLDITKRTKGEGHVDYATLLSNLGSLNMAMGDLAKAEPLLLQALESWKRAQVENHPGYARTRNNLASLYRLRGDYEQAEPLLRQALEITQRVLGEEHRDYALSLNNLGQMYWDMRDYVKAEPLLRQALEIRKRALGEDHHEYAINLINLGMLYQHMGDNVKTELLLRQALEISKQRPSENQFSHAAALKGLAVLDYSRGLLNSGERYAGQGLTTVTQWTSERLVALSERQRIHLIASQGDFLMLYLSIAPAAGIGVEEIYRHALAWKGIVEARQDEDRLARDQPGLKGTLVQLAHARADLARVAFATPPANQRQDWRQQLDALHERKETLEGELARESGAYRRVQETRRFGATEVATALPPATAFIDLLDYVHSSPPEGGKGPLRSERRLLAFVVRRGQAPVLVPLGQSEPITTAVRAWREAQVEDKSGAMEAASLELSRRVWEPIKPHLGGASTILVAPDGDLASFPLAALPGQNSGTYLLEDFTIGYVGSAHRLVELLAAPAEEKADKPEAAGLLAIGGIDYQADPGGAPLTGSPLTPGLLVVDSDRAGFKALAGTGPEAQQIGRLFNAAFPQQHALVLTGAEPTERVMKKQLGRHWRYLHLATHGFFESPVRVSALRAGLRSDDCFGTGLPSPLETDASASLALAPLLHSGVALAGAACKPEVAGSVLRASLPDRDDGILTAEEVQSLDLRGTELVVLSACETGLGKNYHGQGVLGLQRAVQSAGARAVVASLWKVDDVATTLLMEYFYANLWSRKLPKLEALRQAQLTILNNPELLKARRAELAASRGIDEKPEKLPNGKATPAANAPSRRSDPSLWAAFILSGDLR